jgi:hypothetical protein
MRRRLPGQESLFPASNKEADDKDRDRNHQGDERCMFEHI